RDFLLHVRVQNIDRDGAIVVMRPFGVILFFANFNNVSAVRPMVRVVMVMPVIVVMIVTMGVAPFVRSWRSAGPTTSSPNCSDADHHEQRAKTTNVHSFVLFNAIAAQFKAALHSIVDPDAR